MLRRLLLSAAVVTLVLVGVGTTLFLTNAPPTVPALVSGDVAHLGTPVVIKLHAQWCPLCMMTRGIWHDIQAEYGARVRMVVFDFTSDETTAASGREADRIGLRTVFDEFEGETGTVIVLNGRSKTVLSSIHGSRNMAEYRAAIDEALRATR